MYNVAKYCTDPEVVRFACKHGIKQNPLYMKCDRCGNIFCEVREELKTGLKNFPEESFSAPAESFVEKKNKLTPAEQWKEIRIGMAVCVVIFVIVRILEWLAG